MKRKIFEFWAWQSMVAFIMLIPFLIIDLIMGRDYKPPVWLWAIAILYIFVFEWFALEFYNKKIFRLNVKIKYFEDEEFVKPTCKGDLIDLRAAEDVEMKKGEFKLIHLGVAMKLPAGYKANVYPRSSTYKNFKIILANSVGQIDNAYCGDNDEWMFPALAMEDTKIQKGERICQFEIVPIQDSINFYEVDSLNEKDRGGIGSTGTN